MSKFDPYEHLNIALNHDGSITRHLNIPKAPASADSGHSSVVSKDVILDAGKKTWLRLYRPTRLPSNDKSVVRLPIIVYVHGNSWVLYHADAVMVHQNCNLFAGDTPAIVVSVNYRLAPESRLPAQYDDVVDALTWVKTQANSGQTGDNWLRDFGDFSRCFLYGASNGGNIVLHAALRALDLDLDPIRVVGLILNQPMLGGKQRTRSELKLAADEYLPLPVTDLMWELALPAGMDRDHRFANPVGDGAYMERLKGLGGRCLVIGLVGDLMMDRQQELVQTMMAKRVIVEAKFEEVGFHRADLIDSRLATAVLTSVKEFVISC